MNEVRVTTYVAIDGKEFTDFEECYLYELGMKRTDKVLRTLKLLNNKKEPITRWEADSKYVADDFGLAFYVSATSKTAVEYFNYVAEECGYEYLPGTGTWFYDDKTWKWKSVDKLMDFCAKIYKAFVE